MMFFLLNTCLFNPHMFDKHQHVAFYFEARKPKFCCCAWRSGENAKLSPSNLGYSAFYWPKCFVLILLQSLIAIAEHSR